MKMRLPNLVKTSKENDFGITEEVIWWLLRICEEKNGKSFLSIQTLWKIDNTLSDLK